MWLMALLPLRRESCCGFLSSLRIHRPRPGFNPRTLGPVASTLTTRPPMADFEMNMPTDATSRLCFCFTTSCEGCIKIKGRGKEMLNLLMSCTGSMCSLNIYGLCHFEKFCCKLLYLEFCLAAPTWCETAASAKETFDSSFHQNY
jgi:hypothetical protein